MKEPFGGSRINAEEEVWVLANKGAEYARTCVTCRQKFYSARLKSEVCYVCWYEDEMEQARTRFEPLAGELEKRLEVETSVDQTGGMVMCLRVPIGQELDVNGNSRKWAWFSELALGDIGVGLYEVGEDGDWLEGSEGEFVEWPGEFQCTGAPACNWCHHPKLCEEVADWATPLIVAFATKETET